MNKIFIFLLIAGLLGLTGCAISTETGQTGAAASPADVWDEAARLMTGTMLLETTASPLSVEQETSLLLLWKGYSAVINSSTSADEEIDALVEQIRGVFTADQMAAIEAMGLTADTYADKLSEVGVQTGMPAGFGMAGDESGTPQMPAWGQMPPGGQMPEVPQIIIGGNTSGPSGSSQRSGGQMPGSAGFPGGQMPGASIMVISGSDSITGETGASSLSVQATQQAGMGFTARTVNRIVLNAVIQYLNKAVNS